LASAKPGGFFVKVFTEFIGTYIFLFVISLAATNGSPLAPLAIGGALMCMVYMGGHWSGGHYNPAVSFGFFLQKKLSASDLIAYWVAQIIAGILAFGTGWYISGKTVAIGPAEGYDVAKACVVEAIFTMALVLVVLNTAVSRKTAGKGFYGLAIGFTIVIAAVAGGPVSGGAFNPAVGIGATVLHATQGGGSWSNIWIPIVAPLLGGAIGSFIWKFQEGAPEPAAE
jgi:aquaporin Z